MSYEVKPARLIDLIQIFDNMREWDRVGVTAFGGSDPDRWAAATFTSAIAIFAMRDDSGNLHGIAGFQEVRLGVVSVWAVGSTFLCRDSMRVAGKFLADTFARIEGNTAMHRIECYVLKDFTAGHRTIKRLGFVEEGVRHAAGANQEDAVSYARCKK